MTSGVFLSRSAWCGPSSPLRSIRKVHGYLAGRPTVFPSRHAQSLSLCNRNKKAAAKKLPSSRQTRKLFATRFAFSTTNHSTVNCCQKSAVTDQPCRYSWARARPRRQPQQARSGPHHSSGMQAPMQAQAARPQPSAAAAASLARQHPQQAAVVSSATSPLARRRRPRKTSPRPVCSARPSSARRPRPRNNRSSARHLLRAVQQPTNPADRPKTLARGVARSPPATLCPALRLERPNVP